MNVGELKIELEKYDDHINIYIGNDIFENIVTDTDIDSNDELKTITVLSFSGQPRINWFFSFGVDHIPYNKNYVKIYGTCKEARDKMFKKFGKRWCFQYPNLNGKNSPNADKWGLTELNI